MEQTWAVRWTLIHVLMHVHTLNKLWDHKQGDLDTHTVTHRGTQGSMKVCTGVEPDMASQVDINTCTDAYTHSKQDVGTEMRQLGHTQRHMGAPKSP